MIQRAVRCFIFLQMCVHEEDGRKDTEGDREEKSTFHLLRKLTNINRTFTC